MQERKKKKTLYWPCIIDMHIEKALFIVAYCGATLGLSRQSGVV